MLTVVDAVGSGAATATAAGVARGAGVVETVETGAGGRIEVEVDGGPKERASSAAKGAAAERAAAEAIVRGVLTFGSALASSVTAIVEEVGVSTTPSIALPATAPTPTPTPIPTSITHHQPQIPNNTQIREGRATYKTSLSPHGD